MILKLFIVWRLGLFLITYLGSKFFFLNLNAGLGSPTPTRSFDFWASWAQWDGGHYFRIAARGYVDERSFAFFPLYPYLIKFTSIIFFDNYIVAGLVLSNIAAILFFFSFYKLATLLYSKKTATFATITYMTFPTSFFLGAMYPESLFLLLVTAAFVNHFQNKFTKAVLLISMSTLTKAFGVVVFASILIEQIFTFPKKKLTKKYFLVFVSGILPFLILLVILFVKFSDPLKFLSVQQYWERKITFPTTTISSYVIPMFNFSARPANDFLDLAITLIFTILLLVSIKKLPLSLWLYSLLVLVIPASTGTLSSMPRYALSSLGTFIIIARLLEGSKRLSLLIWLVSLTLQTLLAVLFVNGYWVA